MVEPIQDDELETYLTKVNQPGFGNKKLLIRLLAAYRATMSHRDQSILKLMMAHESQGYTIRNVSPDYLFGKHFKSSLDNEIDAGNKCEVNVNEEEEEANSLVINVQNNQTNQANENNEENKKSVKNEMLFFKQFTKLMLHKTSLNIPNNLQLGETIECENWYIYDVRFLLPVYYHLLSNPNLDIKEFIDKHCLAITLSCITLASEQMRKSAYAVLSLFQKRCQDDYGNLWKLLLNRLQATICKIPSNAISPLLINCLIQIIPLINQPNAFIYDHIANYLTKSALITPQSTIEFLKILLKLEDPQSKFKYPKLALAILHGGLRTEQDFKICFNNNFIDFLLHLYHSPLFHKSLRPALLEVFETVCSIPKGAKQLLVERTFLLWLNEIMISNHTNTIILDRINQIITRLLSYQEEFYTLHHSDLKLMKHTYLLLIDRLL